MYSSSDEHALPRYTVGLLGLLAPWLIKALLTGMDRALRFKTSIRADHRHASKFQVKTIRFCEEQ
jgi:hypothetical protein